MVQSYLIISRDQEKIQTYIEDFVQLHSIRPFDRELYTEDKTLGIEQIRLVQKKIFLRPVQGDEKLVVLIVPDITLEGQNALLKTLEEPPLNTFFFLCVQGIESVIPTILSRCQLVLLDGAAHTHTNEEIEKTRVQLFDIQKASDGEKLFYAQTLGKSKEQAVSLLEKMILAERATILQMDKEQHISIARLMSLQETYQQIKTSNISPRFALEVLFLSFSAKA